MAIARQIAEHVNGTSRRAVTSTARRAPATQMSPLFGVIESKFHRPPVRAGTVSRRALVDRLSSSGARVVAIVAPAGYGKTTLLGEWAETDTRAVAWVSLDAGDNDPVVLLTHLAVALDRIEPLSPLVFAALSSRGPTVMSTVLPRLAAALASMTRPVVLLLDDIHSLVDPACLDAVAELAERLPADSQLAATSRSVPALPLARLRARGVLAEVGASDLALDAGGARWLMKDAGVDLSDEVVAELTERTEGWPTGLYLAALSVLGRRNGEIQGIAFTGDDRFVADYVRSEILTLLPDDVVQFLVRSSVLDSMSGSLCDAVLLRSGSAQVLDSIESSNLLLVPLDNHRKWYRYHHLLRDVLVTELNLREPDLAPLLHGRAADWYDANGMPEDAVHHAYAGGDHDRAALLLEQLALPLSRTGRLKTMQAWLNRLDEKVMERHPSLAVLAGWAAAMSGDAIGAIWWADLAERSTFVEAPLDGSASTESTLHLLHALICRRGVDRMREDAEVAVRLETEGSPWRPEALVLQGVATLLAGDVDRADDVLADAVESGERIGAFPVVSVALAERSLLAVGRGNWTAARGFADRALATVETGQLDEHLLSSITFAAVARTAIQHGDVTVARREVMRTQRLRPMLTRAIPWLAVQTMVELARVQFALSDRAGAWMLLSDAREIVRRMQDPGVLTDQLTHVQRRLEQIRGGDLPGPTALTAAELRLLSYLPTHLSFREIAERLSVSPNTIKTQAMSIYRKLSVSARTDAVRRARDVGLLEE
jgi:LuxR family transcriptional regulator, maltose regulon positive regulatory protein